MTKYLVIVNAGQTWTSSYADEYRQLAERCVHLEARSSNDAVRKAETIRQIIYPEANVFDSYKVVNEHEDPDEVLRLVIGWARGQEPRDLFNPRTVCETEHLNNVVRFLDAIGDHITTAYQLKNPRMFSHT
jgi:hypothetical protein